MGGGVSIDVRIAQLPPVHTASLCAPHYGISCLSGSASPPAMAQCAREQEREILREVRQDQPGADETSSGCEGGENRVSGDNFSETALLMGE